MQPIWKETDGLLLRGAFNRNTKLIGMCELLYDHRDWLWSFLEIERRRADEQRQ